jgi:hypothetical protein
VDFAASTKAAALAWTRVALAPTGRAASVGGMKSLLLALLAVLGSVAPLSAAIVEQPVE